MLGNRLNQSYYNVIGNDERECRESRKKWLDGIWEQISLSAKSEKIDGISSAGHGWQQPDPQRLPTFRVVTAIV